MIFRKKKRVVRRSGGMIDISKLQRKGKVLSPKKKVPELDTDSDGYVVVSKSSSSSSLDNESVSDSNDFVSGVSSFSSEKDGYSKREVDSKIQELDNKIYKLEQRIEVLERKAGVDSGYSNDSSSSSGLIGW